MTVTTTQLTLKVVTFPIHEDVVDQNDTKDTRPEVNIAEYEHKSNILQEKTLEALRKHLYKIKQSALMGLVTYKEYVEEDEQRDLDHADLHSNTTAHFKAAESIMLQQLCTFKANKVKIQSPMHQ